MIRGFMRSPEPASNNMALAVIGCFEVWGDSEIRS